MESIQIKQKIKMSSHYYNLMDQYVQMYGPLPSGDAPILLNITGPFRDAIYAKDNQNYLMTLLKMSIILCIGCALPTGIPVTMVTLFALAYVFASYDETNPFVIYNGRFRNINGRTIGVIIPTQEQEGELESKNFVQTNDRKRLFAAAKIPLDAKYAVWSVGSSSTQCIDGHANTIVSEIAVGVNNREKIAELLKAQKDGGYMFVMNSAGYGVCETAGIVFADNNNCENNITPNIVQRTIGGTGNNENAMAFVNELVAAYKAGGYNFVLGVIPRGDKSLPQGGSHSKQRIVDAIDRSDGIPITVIEVSGKQTQIFTIVDDCELETYSTETLCGRIKVTKVVAKDGKSYGSGTVFR
jgi:hypothetical protein